jgi:hypothetical protein
MRAATGEARHRAPNAPDARESAPAIRTFVNETRSARADRKWQRVTARFIPDAEIATGRVPFCAVCGNAATAGAELREQMRQFMPKRAVNFSGAVLLQKRI